MLVAEVRNARRAGLRWPDGWNEAKIAQYLAGPWAHACELQRLADSEAETAHRQRLMHLRNERDSLYERIDGIESTPMTPDKAHQLWHLKADLENLASEFGTLRRKDWQDHVSLRERRDWVTGYRHGQ